MDVGGALHPPHIHIRNQCVTTFPDFPDPYSPVNPSVPSRTPPRPPGTPSENSSPYRESGYLEPRCLLLGFWVLGSGTFL